MALLGCFTCVRVELGRWAESGVLPPPFFVDFVWFINTSESTKASFEGFKPCFCGKGVLKRVVPILFGSGVLSAKKRAAVPSF